MVYSKIPFLALVIAVVLDCGGGGGGGGPTEPANPTPPIVTAIPDTDPPEGFQPVRKGLPERP